MKNLTETILKDFDDISSVKGKLKLGVLPNISETTRALMKMSFDPFLTFGVSKLDIQKSGNYSADRVQSNWKNIVTHLEQGKGRQIRDDLLEFMSEEQVRIVNGVFNGFQDFKLGVSGTTFLKVFPGEFKTFSLQLAAKYDNDKFIPGSFSQPKFDGVRCVVIVDHKGSVSTLSRNGKQINNINEYLIKYLSCFRGFVFDGEVLAINDETNFDKSVGIVHRHNSDEKLTIKIFDMLTLEEFESKKCELGYLDRYIRLNNTIGTNFIATHTQVFSDEEVRNKYAEYRAAGLEGSIIKEKDGLYSFKRSKAWAKIKNQMEVDGRVIGFQEGRGRLKGKLGAFVVEFEKDGPRTSVGGGYSDKQRIEYWGRRDEMIGKIISIEGHEWTKDKVVRHPRFLQVRWDKDDTSTD